MSIENFDKAFEDREFNKAYTYIFDMLAQVMISFKPSTSLQSAKKKIRFMQIIGK
jgi:hypothetical protein